MSLEEIYYIGQTIAVIAILISLIGIFIQLRQSSMMERASAQRELLGRVSEYSRNFTPEESDQWVLGLADFEGAPHTTKALVHNRLIEFVFITESALNMHRDGFFSEGTWVGIEGAMIGMLRTPGGQSFWAYAQHLVGFEIAEHLTRRLAEVGLEGPDILDAIPFHRERMEQLTGEAGS